MKLQLDPEYQKVLDLNPNYSRPMLYNPATRELYEDALKRFLKEVEPMIREIEQSQRITAADLAVTINAR